MTSHPAIRVKADVYERIRKIADADQRTIAATVGLALDLYESWRDSQRDAAAFVRIPAEITPTPESQS